MGRAANQTPADGEASAGEKIGSPVIDDGQQQQAGCQGS